MQCAHSPLLGVYYQMGDIILLGEAKEWQKQLKGLCCGASCDTVDPDKLGFCPTFQDTYVRSAQHQSTIEYQWPAPQPFFAYPKLFMQNCPKLSFLTVPE